MALDGESRHGSGGRPRDRGQVRGLLKIFKCEELKVSMEAMASRNSMEEDEKGKTHCRLVYGVKNTVELSTMGITKAKTKDSICME